MMFSSIKGMKFFITFKTIVNILVLNPFLLGAKRCFDYFTNLIVHVFLLRRLSKLNEKKLIFILYNTCIKFIELKFILDFNILLLRNKITKKINVKMAMKTRYKLK